MKAKKVRKEKPSVSPPFFLDASAASSAARCSGVRKPVAAAASGAAAAEAAPPAPEEEGFVDPPPPVMSKAVTICEFFFLGFVVGASQEGLFSVRIDFAARESSKVCTLDKREIRRKERNMAERESTEEEEEKTLLLHRQRVSTFFCSVQLPLRARNSILLVSWCLCAPSL